MGGAAEKPLPAPKSLKIRGWAEGSRYVVRARTTGPDLELEASGADRASALNTLNQALSAALAAGVRP